MKTIPDWRTTISGACASAGTFVFGIPTVIVAAKFDVPGSFTIGLMVFGMVLQGLGIFFAHLFAVDAKDLKQQLDQRTAENEAKFVKKGDTTL